METPANENDDRLARIIMLVFGTMKEGGGSYWCYVAIKPSAYALFMERHQAGSVNLYDFEKEGFGEIVVSGKGRQPPSEVTYQVAQVYKLDLDDLYKETDAEKVLAAKKLSLKDSPRDA